LFYLTVKNSKIDSPGCPSTSGYGISDADITIKELVINLINEKNKNNNQDTNSDQLLPLPRGRNNILSLLSSSP